MSRANDGGVFNAIEDHGGAEIGLPDFHPHVPRVEAVSGQRAQFEVLAGHPPDIAAAASSSAIGDLNIVIVTAGL